jgi:hypothetical protein
VTWRCSGATPFASYVRFQLPDLVPVSHRRPGTPMPEAHPPNQRSAQRRALPDQSIASVRLAYGYAQYGYTQRRDFLCVMNASTAAANAVEHCHLATLAIMDARPPVTADPAGNAGELAHAAQVSAPAVATAGFFSFPALPFPPASPVMAAVRCWALSTLRWVGAHGTLQGTGADCREPRLCSQ